MLADRSVRPWRKLLGPGAWLLLVLPAALFTNALLDACGVPAGTPARMVWERVPRVIAWVLAASVVNRMLRLYIFDGLVARRLKGPAPRVLKDLVSILVYLAAAAGITSFVFDRSITAFLATIGAGSIVLGWALRGLLSDVFTGLALNFERPFAIGDWLRIPTAADGPVDARVREINWRSTHLLTDDGRLVVIPNSRLGDEGFANYWRPSREARFEVRLTIDFSVPASRVFRVVHGAARSVSDEPGFVSDKPAQVLIDETTELGVCYLVRFWIRPWDGVSPAAARSRMLESILFHLRQAGIAPAYPKEDHFTAPMPRRHLERASTEDLVRLLGEVDLFRQLGPAERQSLAGALVERLYADGATVIRQGEAGDSMFILMEGVLEVFVDRAGAPVRVARLEPGRVFGEMSLLTGATRSATVVASGETVAFEVGKAAVDQLLLDRPELAAEMARVMAAREVQSLAALGSATPKQDEQVAHTASHLLARITGFFGLDRAPPRNR